MYKITAYTMPMALGAIVMHQAYCSHPKPVLMHRAQLVQPAQETAVWQHF